MKYILILQNNKVIGSCSGSDDYTPTPEEGTTLKEVSRPVHAEYMTTVFYSNGTKYYQWNETTEVFEILDTPTVPATINKMTITAGRTDTAIISGLPNPSTVYMADGAANYTVTDGVFEFSMDTPGTYKIICTAKGYLQKEFTIDAN